MKSAIELVDWLRLVSRPLNPSEFLRLVRTVERLHSPAVKQLWQYLEPQHSPLQVTGFIESLGELENTYVTHVAFS
jgi:hypothetical protein